MSDFALFLGRFHPILVHFPIALLALAALLQVIAFASRRRPGARVPAVVHAMGLVLWLGALAAVASAVAGLLLASSGGYGGDIFTRHQWLGLILSGLSLVGALAWTVGNRGARWPRVQFVLTVACGLLLIPVGHLGANLTHGEGYLAEHAPQFLRGVLGRAKATAPVARTPETVKVFADLVAPALQSHCVSCHGPAKVESGLRLDTFEWISKGGDDGPVIVMGRSASSEIVRRVFLPSSHDDAMPPSGHRSLAPADATLLRWWIDQGASASLTVADADVTPEVAPILEALIGPIGGRGPTLPAAAVPAAPAKALTDARTAGFTIEPVADGTSYLNVHATNARDRVDDKAVASLRGLAPQVLWLDLGNTGVTDAALETVGSLAHVTNLRLNGTAVSDAGLEQLANLVHLESLNLYDTRVSDRGVAKLVALKQLRTLYLWRTNVTADGVANLKAALPKLTVEMGS